MSAFLTLLPIYLFGNLHCLGMCGPLAASLTNKQGNHLYFLGRMLSFTFAGLTAALFGTVITNLFSSSHFNAYLSLVMGIAFIFFAFMHIQPLKFSPWKTINHTLSNVITISHSLSPFIFGMITIALPCGQTIIVFSTIALLATPLEGFINGLLFAIFTSPSLIIAMYLPKIFDRGTISMQKITTCVLILAGFFSLLRGFAELNLIHHLVINPSADPKWHILLY